MYLYLIRTLNRHQVSYCSFCEKMGRHWYFLDTSLALHQVHRTNWQEFLFFVLLVVTTSESNNNQIFIHSATIQYYVSRTWFVFISLFPFLFPGFDKWEGDKCPTQGNCKLLQGKAVHNLLRCAATACTNFGPPRDSHSQLTPPVPALHLGRVQEDNVLPPPEPQPPQPLPHRPWWPQQCWQRRTRIGSTCWTAGRVYGGD